jgi:magnesium transporter
LNQGDIVMSGFQFYYVSPKKIFTKVGTVDEAMTAVKNGGFLWLDYNQPQREDIAPLITLLEFHPLSIEDCLDENELPKMDDYPHNAFIIFNAFEYEEKRVILSEIDLFIGTNFLVTITQRDSVHHQIFEDIEQIENKYFHCASHGPAFLMHIILDHVVDQKYLVIDAVENELDNQEEIMMADLANFNPTDLIRLRRDLLNLRKSLFHEREILVKICRKDCPFISDKAIFHYRDLYDHITKFLELTEAHREIVTNLMEIYLSLLNNQMTKAANQTNATVRRLTFITTIFMPLTLLAGIGGMSEWSMMTGPDNWKISYPLFILIMIIIGIANYYVLKWMEKKK